MNLIMNEKETKQTLKKTIKKSKINIKEKFEQ